MSSERTASRQRPPLPRAKKASRRTPRPVQVASAAPPLNGASTSSLLNGLLVTAFFAAATILLTYPLSVNPSSASRLDNGDARLNAWAISWVTHQLFEDPLNLFQANIFYPLENTLAFSEHLLVEGIIAAPILWLSDDLVLTQNLVFLFGTFMGGVSMYLLTSAVTGSRVAGLLAGLFFSFAPYRFNRLPHIQMQLYGFLPLTLWALYRFFQTLRRRWLVLLAAAFVLQVLSGTYLAAMVAIAMAIGVPMLASWSGMGRRDWFDLALSLSLAALVILPFVIPYLWVNRALGVEWDLEGVAQLAATPKSYLAASSHLHRGWTEALTTPRDRIDYLFPSFSLAILGALGTSLMLQHRKTRRMALYLLVLATVGIVLSLGPMTPVYRWLFDSILFFRGLRALPRFSLLALIALALTAGYAVAWLERRSGRGSIILGVTALVYVAETTALPYDLEDFRDTPPPVYDWLATAKPGPIVELPYKVIDTRYMFWARHHRFRPMLNGDSGFIPESHNWIKQALQRFPSPDSIELLRRQRVRYVVVHLGAFRKRALVRLLNGLQANGSALLPARDFGRDTVFEILPPLESREAGVSKPNFEPVAIVGAGIPTLVDGDSSVAWEADRQGQEVSLTIASTVPIEAVRLHYGAHPRVPASGIELYRIAEDASLEQVYATAQDWPALTELVEGLLADPSDGTQLIRFPPVQGESFELRLFGLDRPIELTEVELLASASGNSPSP